MRCPPRQAQRSPFDAENEPRWCATGVTSQSQGTHELAMGQPAMKLLWPHA
jgi:hypothetical protein